MITCNNYDNYSILKAYLSRKETLTTPGNKIKDKNKTKNYGEE